MALGYPHPDYLLPKLTVRQFREWQMYYDIEPWGTLHEDMQHSFSRKIAAEAGGMRGKGKKQIELSAMSLNEQFTRIRMRKRMEKNKLQVPKQSVEEMKSILFSIAKAGQK